METTKPEHKEVRIIVEEPEVKDITTMMDTEIRSVGELVADWERMCTMEENVMVTKEGDKPNRRVSDRIKRLSANFVNSGQGKGVEGEGAELMVSGREVVDQTKVNIF